MKFLKAKFHNFLGIKSGLGMNDLEIDFTRAKHRICLIVGKNGSGKTSILEGLSLFSDIYAGSRDSSSFLLINDDGKKDAWREITLQNGNDIYISKVYWLNDKTKCYLTQVFHDGSMKEWNESGNVRSYEEVLESLFNLTKEYNRLLHLGPGLRDIVVQTPGERKQNIGKFVPNTEEYIEAYKDSQKYHMMLKNDIAIFTEELRQLGSDRDTIEENRNSVQIKLNNERELLQSMKTVEANVVTSINALSINDVSIDTLYNRYKTRYENTCNRLEELNKKLFILYEKHGLKAGILAHDFEVLVRESGITLSKLIFQQDNYITRYNELTNNKDITTHLRDTQQHLLDMYILNNNPEKFLKEQRNLYMELEDITKSENRIREEIPELQTLSDILFTKEDTSKYMICVDTILSTIDSIKSLYTENDILHRYINNTLDDLSNDEEALRIIENTKKKLEKEMESIKSLTYGFEQSKDLRGLLQEIPKDCKNPLCPFIKKAESFFELEKTQKAILERYYVIEKEVTEKSKEIKRYEEFFSNIKNFHSEILRLSSFISNHMELCCKFPDYKLLTHLPTLLSQYQVLLPHARKYSEYSYLIERYSGLQDRLITIADEIQKNDNYFKVKEEKEKELNNMNQQITEIIESLEQLNNLNSNIGTEVDFMKIKVSDLEEISELRITITSLLKAYSSLKDTLKMISKRYSQYKYFTSRLKILRQKILDTETSIIQYEKELNTLEYKLLRFDEIQKKKILLESDYEKLDVLRKCWSPTTGIPLIFIEGFMDTLLIDANVYLTQLWTGDDILRIAGFEIDEKNFYINIEKGDIDIPYTDASQCSGAEKAMICTVLSLALLKQLPGIESSYNITKYDEIDNALDYERKRIFLDILNELLDSIGSEQAFFISHSDIFQGNIDIILLKGSEEYSGRLFGDDSFNPIYSFDTVI